jgi:hypothetical protein
VNFDADAEAMFRRICSIASASVGTPAQPLPGTLCRFASTCSACARHTRALASVRGNLLGLQVIIRPLKACGLRQLRCTFARVGKVDATVDEGVTGGVESHIFGLDAGHVMESAGRATLSAKRLTVVEAPAKPGGDAAGMLFSLHSGAH